MKPRVKFEWRGIHHGYLGGWFIGFGVFFLYMNTGNSLDLANYLYESFIIIGCYLVCDDLVEHLWTEDTPLRRLWNWMLGHKSWW